MLRGGRELGELGGAIQTSHVLFVELDDNERARLFATAATELLLSLRSRTSAA